MFSKHFITALVTAAALAATSLATQIRPVTDSNKCLDIEGEVLANNALVVILDCKGSPTQNWIINPDGKVQATPNFCLEAGPGPEMRIQFCDDLIPEQAWFYGLGPDTLSIKRRDADLCLTLTRGGAPNGNVGAIPCIPFNPIQDWIKNE